MAQTSPAVSIERDSERDHYCRVQGELSYMTVPHISGQLIPLMDDQQLLQIDLSGVSRSDSAGVAMLVDWLRQARQTGADLRYLNIPDQMLSIARVSGLDTILPFSRSRE